MQVFRKKVFNNISLDNLSFIYYLIILLITSYHRVIIDKNIFSIVVR
jgi:hypothetical protein